MTLKAIKCRIYPNQAQQDKIIANFGYTRFVWNQLLAMQNERYANGGKFVNEFGMNYLIKELKREHPFLKQAESTSLLHVSRDLSHAFQKLFKEHLGQPKFKSRKYPKQSYQCNSVNHNIQVIGKSLKLPKLGKITFKSGLITIGAIKNVTIKKSFAGKFYAVLLVDTEIKQLPKSNREVGIDMGVADLMITSDGLKLESVNPD